jgi:hypothetical protein
VLKRSKHVVVHSKGLINAVTFHVGSWAIPCTGKQVYARCHREEWLGKISEPGVRRRAEFYFQQLDALRLLRQEVRRDLSVESRKHKAWKRLCQIPAIGPIRAAVLIGILQTPQRRGTTRA